MSYSVTVSTNEEAFRAIVHHLVRMDKQSTRRSPDTGAPYPAYRGSGGRMCAIGCIITDEAYDPDMDTMIDSTGVDDLVLEGLLKLPPEIDQFMLESLQALHDEKANWASDGFTALHSLRDVAKQWGIDPDIVSEELPSAEEDASVENAGALA